MINDQDPCKILPFPTSHKIYNANDELGNELASSSLGRGDVTPEITPEPQTTDAKSAAMAPSGSLPGVPTGSVDGKNDLKKFLETAPNDLQKFSETAPLVGGDKAPPGLLRLQNLSGQGHDLALWAARYLLARVVGGSPNTLDAKSRDLAAFIEWFVEINGHADVTQWLVRDTRLYMRQMESRGRAPNSINRAFASLRHFARWLHEQPGSLFVNSGLPTATVRELVVDEGDCKKLERREVHALLKAADARVLLDQQQSRARPRRNRAILALLYYSGLRVSELVGLRRDQLQGNYLVNVARKGRTRSKGLYLVAECRRQIDDYLQTERLSDDPQSTAEPLFLSEKGRTYLNRRDVGRLLDRLAAEASKHRTDPIEVHPHRLRHTFGSEFREKSGSDSETAQALGHTGLKYVGRYVRKSQQEREELMENLFADR